MIISRTPLRISFVGGGSDLPLFFEEHGGAVVSTSINKYVYVLLNKRFESGIRLSYSKNEEVDNINQIQHRIIKETLKFFGEINHIELTSIADIPSKGSGLGSSSSFTNGLVNVISHYLNIKKNKKQLAETSSYIEIYKCNQQIGFQDQYASSFGGLNFIEFKKDKINVKPIKCNKKTLLNLQDNLLLFSTGINRKASNILKKQTQNMQKNSNLKDCLKKMVEYSNLLKKDLINNNISNFGELLHENWILKKKLNKNISNSIIDEYYDIAKKSGALGGKLLGAGKGGFLLFYAERKDHEKITKSLKGLKNLKFKFESLGSKVIFKNKN